jgi:tetratricopeptide (TPR) repeat protein
MKIAMLLILALLATSATIAASGGGEPLTEEIPVRAAELWVDWISRATLARVQRRYAEAELAYEQARRHAEPFGETSAQMAVSASGLGMLRMVEGRRDEAEMLLRRAAVIWEARLASAGQPATPVTEAKSAPGIPDAESAAQENAWIGGPPELHLAASWTNLAVLHFHGGRHAQAESLCRKALAVLERLATPGDLEPLVALTLLSQLHQERGDLDGAEAFARRALELAERTLSAGHPELSPPLNQLAIVLFRRGRYEEAAELFIRALNLFSRAFGDDSTKALIALANLAQTRHLQGRTTEAAELFQEMLSGIERSSHPHHPDFVEPLQLYASFLRAIKRKKEAARLERQAREIQARNAGPDYSGMTVSLRELSEEKSGRRRGRP